MTSLTFQIGGETSDIPGLSRIVVSGWLSDRRGPTAGRTGYIWSSVLYAHQTALTRSNRCQIGLLSQTDATTRQWSVQYMYLPPRNGSVLLLLHLSSFDTCYMKLADSCYLMRSQQRRSYHQSEHKLLKHKYAKPKSSYYNQNFYSLSWHMSLYVRRGFAKKVEWTMKVEIRRKIIVSRRSILIYSML